MANQFIASFNKDVVRTDFVSETNSIKYKLELGGGHAASPNPFLLRNGTDLLGSFVDGMNIREFSSIDSFPVVKSFNFSKTSGNSINSAFVTYMNSSTAKFIVLISSKNLYSATDIDNWFKSAGSVAWPNQFMCNNYKIGYVAIYSPSLKKIVAEVAKYSDGNDTGHAEYKCICDVENDLGSLGLPKKIIYDESEKSASDKQGVYNYYINTLLPAINVKVGDNLLLSCDLYKTDSSPNQLSVLWIKESDGSVVDSTNLIATSNTYQNYEAYLKVPQNADRMAVYCEKYGSDLVGCKNVSLVQITEPKTNSTTAYMGVNGIKATKFVEKSEGDLLNLKMKVSTKDNVVPVVNIQESKMNIKYEYDFTSSETLPSYLSISRMSNGSRMNSSGMIEELGYDLPRFDFSWDGSRYVNKGLYIEKQSTNLVGNSDLAAGLVNWGTLSLTYTKTQYGTWMIEPNNSTDRVTFQNPMDYRILNLSGTKRYNVSAYYAASRTLNYNYFLRPNVSGSNLTLGLMPNSYMNKNANPLQTRFNIFYDYTSNVPTINGDLLLGINALPNHWVNIGYTQVEESNYPTSWIRTSKTPMTRAQDYLILKLSNYTGSVKLTYSRHDNDLEESIYVDCKNLTNDQISDSIPVGCYLKSIKVYEYTLSEKEKNV